jgi:hypothetical protein
MTVNPEKYAKALLKNKFYSTYEEALAEANRFNNQALNGMVEALKCYPDPDSSLEVKNLVEGGAVVNVVKNNKLNS